MTPDHSEGFPSALTPEDRLKLVLALDHDARQPRHVLELGLRNLRLFTTELEHFDSNGNARLSLLRRMKAELACVQIAVRQVVDAQQDLVDAIRFDFDEVRPSLRRIIVGDLVERVLASNRAVATGIKLRAAKSRLAFVSDERWVERILNNLILNAVLHSGGDKVLLGVRVREGDIAFEVRDNGRRLKCAKPNVVSELKAKVALFPPSALSVRSGLGLYNVRLLTERLGGTVHCTSGAKCGTLFRVRLPGPVERGGLRLRIADGSDKSALRNKTLVLLDDDLVVLRTTERVFEQLGVEVYADHDPLRWLSVVTDFKRAPDLILLDYQLKGQDCSLLLEIVRRKWADSMPKIAVITGQAHSSNLIRLAQDVPVFQKPFSDATFKLLVEVLSGASALPNAGFN